MTNYYFTLCRQYLYIILLFVQDDPQTWSVEQVCQWLELVGLGTYRDTFKGTLYTVIIIIQVSAQIRVTLLVYSRLQ